MNKSIQILLVLLLLISPEVIFAQCAMCRAVLESGENQPMAEGINNGIMYLMAVPYLLLAGVGYYIFKRMK